MSKCIVSFSALGRENYDKGILRLIKSCVDSGWDGDYLIRSYTGYCDNYMGVNIELGSYPITQRDGLCYNMSEVPYGFKPSIVLEAKEKGAQVVVWADSTIVMLSNIQPLLDYAKKHGVCAFNNLGYPLKGWISDYCLDRSGMSESDLETAKQCMGCLLIFDFTNKKGEEIFEKWYAMSRDGVSFQNYGSERNGFKSHRHDQSAISAILHFENIPLLEYGDGFCYHPHELGGEFTDGKEVFIINKGL